MKAEFTKLALHSGILLEAESLKETEILERWDNCVLSAKYEREARNSTSAPALLIVKEPK